MVSSYLQGDHGSPARMLWNDLSKAPGDDIVKLAGIRVLDNKMECSDAHKISDPISVEVEYEVLEGGNVVQPHLEFMNGEGSRLFVSVDLDKEWRKVPRPTGRYISRVLIHGDLLAEGMVIVNVAIWVLAPIHLKQCYEKDIVSFQIIDNMDGEGARGDWAGEFSGLIRPKLTWETNRP